MGEWPGGYATKREGSILGKAQKELTDTIETIEIVHNRKYILKTIIFIRSEIGIWTGSWQKRISNIQFRAIALNSKIPAGRSVDDQCIDEILSLMDQVERINKKNLNVKKEAQNILEKFDDIDQKIQSTRLRQQYGSLRSNLITTLNKNLQ